MPRLKSLYTITKQVPRMSWNKYNVYNVHQMKPIRAKKFPLNLLSLRFHAKRAARKYHGQGLSERIFKRQLYNPMINVVASPPGAENGKLLIWGGLFQGVERRFDNVIFRSLFASSIQQARQMIVHGHVELNGKIEHRPGLLLRPGDIYHADPQMVKKYISNHFHLNFAHFDAGRREKLMEARIKFLQNQGRSVTEVQSPRLPSAERFEYSPYIPIALQGQHPIIRLLDDEAKKEEEDFQKKDVFVPKPYMSPNVFLPAYLEVSYRSCTGCFVRMPQVKKDGKMEIPSPYAPDIHEQTGMFYARFAKKASQRGYTKYKLFQSKRRT